MSLFSQEMWEAYLRTEYHIGAPLNLCLLVGQKSVGLPEMPWAYLTAWNPHSILRSEAVNRENQSELENRLLSRGVRYIPGMAHDPLLQWPDEEGALAMGLEREAALELGREFGQNAILVGVGEGTVQLVRC